MNSKILIIGACGQIGSELTYKLRSIYGTDYVIASDIKPKGEVVTSGPFEIIDAKDYDAIKQCIEKDNVDTVYLLAAMLSASGEQNPTLAWDLNMTSLLHILNLAKEGFIKKIFWPSSIAVFGPTTPKSNTPQSTIIEPTTVYGITKLAGERWCDYYYRKYGVDVRSLRFPGVISYKTRPGGGTTDYAVDIYHKAIENQKFTCFLSENTMLPMMYIDDVVNATLQLMNADSKTLTVRSSYNISAVSFSPKMIAETIQQHIPSFKIDYNPDFRQQIADSWPDSIDDSQAKNDWNWQPKFSLEQITTEMLSHLKTTETA